MGNLKGPWLLSWVGDTKGCEEYNTTDLESKIEIIFQTSQSGTGFIVQRTNAADSAFATIKKLGCGSGCVIKVKEDTQLPHVVQSTGSTQRIKPNFPIEIEVSGLSSTFSNGNGIYILTTQFKANYPTYKNPNGWIFEKNDTGWSLVHNVDGLNILANNSRSPVVGPYKEVNCKIDNCQTAFVKDITETGSGVVLPDLENLKTTEIKTNSFSISWEGVNNISHYEIEISDTLDFSQSAKAQVDKNQQFYEFKNLTDGKIYYYRLKYKNYLEKYDSIFFTRKVTTALSGKRFNLSVTLNANFHPELDWEIPSNLNYTYYYSIFRSKDTQNWTKLKTYKDDVNVTESPEFEGKDPRIHYIDTTITDESLYYYAMQFNNGVDGDFSSVVSIRVDKERPNPPKVTAPISPTNKKDLYFTWQSDSNVNHYLYKFNGSEWAKYTQNNITIPGKQGENIFILKAVDDASNESYETIKKIIVDTIPPPAPEIADIGEISNKTELTFSWTVVTSDGLDLHKVSSDLKEFLYRINNGLWIQVDKSVSSVTIKTVQGANKFDIKSVDVVGNHSIYVSHTVNVDYIPPKAPVLEKVASPTKNKSLYFSWNSEQVNGFKYRITLWKSASDTKTVGSWNTIEKEKRSISLNGVDGYFRFEIYSYDSFGNNSDVASQTILVDYTPPKIPELKEVSLVPDDNTGKLKITYDVILDETSTSASYRLNNGGWVQYDVKSDANISLLLNEGTNTIEIYSVDVVGNKSDTHQIQKFIDTIAPTTPKFISPLGGSPAGLRSDLWKLCQLNSTLDEVTTINITYSYMNAGTPVNFEELNLGSRHPKTKVVALWSNSATEFEFKTEIEAGFRSFKKIIEELYNKIQINFISRGDEPSALKNIPVGLRYGFDADEAKELGLGDIRIGLVDKHIETYSEIKNPDTDLFLNLGCILLDKNLTWKSDANVTTTSYSIQYALRYFLGKVLGLPDNKENTHGTQHSLQQGKSVKNTESADKNLFSKIYEYPTLGGKTMKVVHGSVIEVAWKSDSNALYEYRYAFISSDGRITSTDNWTQLSTTLSKEGKKIFNLTDEEKLNSLLRVYVRSLDESGNTSDESYIDVKLPSNDLDTNIQLVSIDEKCETNLQYKNNSNCWDSFGLFSAELLVTKSSLNNQYLIVEVKDSTSKFARYEKIETLNGGKFTINSLKPDTTYTFRALIVNKGTDLSTTSTTYNNLVGEYFGSFSNFKTIKTSKSYMVIPNKPTINTIVHFRHKDQSNSKFIFPLGESHSIVYILNEKTNIKEPKDKWTPTCVVTWSISNDQFFKSYVIKYKENNVENSVKTVSILDKSKTTFNLKLDKNNTIYKIQVGVSDTLGNTVWSDWNEYKTVPLDTQPKEMSEFKVDYSGEIKSIYNERPTSKWTLSFRLPKSLDDQFPSLHSKPDVEDFTRKDYSLLDWMSSIGHPPMRIRYKPQGAPVTSLWITHSDVYDNEFNKTDIRINKDDTGYYIKVPGFDENYKYDFVYTIYDLTGHYIQQSVTLETKSKSILSSPVTFVPSITVERNRYINGLDSNGKSLEAMQWILDVKTTIPTTNSIKHFYVRFRKSTETYYTKRFELDISKIPSERIWTSGSSIVYTLRISGFDPKTRYYFKVDAVNDFGNMSKSSNEVEFVTPVGDKSNPEQVNLKFIRKATTSSGTSQVQFGLMKPSEPTLDFVLFHTIHTTSTNKPSSIWQYTTKNYISADRINKYWASGVDTINIAIKSDANKYHSCVFMWRDSAFNYSAPYLKTLTNTSTGLSQLLSETENEDDNVLVLQ